MQTKLIFFWLGIACVYAKELIGEKQKEKFAHFKLGDADLEFGFRLKKPLYEDVTTTTTTLPPTTTTTTLPPTTTTTATTTTTTKPVTTTTTTTSTTTAKSTTTTPRPTTTTTKRTTTSPPTTTTRATTSISPTTKKPSTTKMTTTTTTTTKPPKTTTTKPPATTTTTRPITTTAPSTATTKVTVTKKTEASKPKESVRLLSANESEIGIVSLESFNEAGESLYVEEIDSMNGGVKQCYITPESNKLTISPVCGDGQKIFVNGKSVKAGKSVTIDRNKQRHTQVVSMKCEKKSVAQEYALLVTSDWPEDLILPPQLSIEESGIPCVFQNKTNRIECPDPKSDSKTVRLVSVTEPSIRYTIQNKDRSVQVRLLPDSVTQYFHYSSGMKVVAQSGQYSKEWPIGFGGSVVATVLNALGMFLAFILALLVAILLVNFALSAASTNGTPIGTTEIAAGLTFLLQFMSFSSIFRSSSKLESLVTPMKFVTMFWPAPFKLLGCDSSKNGSGTHFSTAYGIKSWDDSRLGDVNDLNNAVGCVFWSVCSLMVVVLFHLFVYVKFAIIERRYTFPHILRFGNWESRALHFVCFPLTVACGVLLKHPESSSCHIGMAVGVLSLLTVWLLAVTFSVRSAIANKSAAWIWNSSVRQTGGEASDLSGYWADTVSDQLVTQPTNRSIVSCIFRQQWVTTVADILPITLSHELLSRKNKEFAPQEKMYKRAHTHSSYPLGSAPQLVQVTRTRAVPCCKTDSLMVGLLRTKWIDILMTYAVLTRLHANQHAVTTVPLIVKTNQLSGPTTNGANNFFFKGVRVPFIRIADALFRLIVGVLMGCAFTTEATTFRSSAFGAVSVIAAMFAIYVFLVNPFTRCFENRLMAVSLIVTSLVSAGIVVLTMKSQSCTYDIFACSMLLTSFVFAAYSCAVVVASCSAMCCPPMEETCFLEKLANCSVSIHERAKSNGEERQKEWSVKVPAYSKYSTKELKSLSQTKNVSVTRVGSLENVHIAFSADEIRNGMRTGILEVP